MALVAGVHLSSITYKFIRPSVRRVADCMAALIFERWLAETARIGGVSS
jgi:hypothetical protein